MIECLKRPMELNEWITFLVERASDHGTPSSDELSATAIRILSETTKRIPQEMKYYFVDLIKKAQELITHAKVLMG